MKLTARRQKATHSSQSLIVADVDISVKFQQFSHTLLLSGGNSAQKHFLRITSSKHTQTSHQFCLPYPVVRILATFKNYPLNYHNLNH